jgi:hypothetical protein
MRTFIRDAFNQAFWTSSQTNEMALKKLQNVFVGALAGTSVVTVGVRAQCPDYSQHSQQYHAPFSAGRYNLSYMRPDPACRTFNSSEVEDTITSMQSVIKDPDLYRLFQNSFPNTLDTAVKWKGFAANNSKEELTFLITGDINVRFSKACVAVYH